MPRISSQDDFGICEGRGVWRVRWDVGLVVGFVDGEIRGEVVVEGGLAECLDFE